MNNDIYTHLKGNIIKRLEGKCFGNYGHITRIYEILEIQGGIIHPENPMASAIYEIKFSCRLCMPLKTKYIICKVDQTTQALTAVSNGPIKVILTNDRINTDKFIAGRTGILVKTDNGIKQLSPGDHIKIKIDSRKFNDKDTIIMCMGVLESMATEDEIIKFEADEYNISSKFVDYDKYIQLEEKKYDINEIGEENNELPEENIENTLDL
jgi:DNA-directed RNA polymerase subunit E'/Rpb7